MVRVRGRRHLHTALACWTGQVRAGMRLAAVLWLRPLAVLFALAVVAVPAGGCSSKGAAGAGATTRQPTPPDLGRFYAQQLSWGSCASFAPSSNSMETFSRATGVDCAYLRVPVDYSQPDDEHKEIAEIAVVRQKASLPDRRVGSLVIDLGGPGLSNTDKIAEGAGPPDRPINQRFDFVGFDPRGVGASRPQIRCLTPTERDADRLDVEVDHSPAGVARIEAKAKDFADKCARRSGRSLLANVGTRDVARDLDILRAALGERKLTYLGYSYGTQLGYTYAELFPQNVRAMVLDGARDPNESLADHDVAQAEGLQYAFDAFAVDCIRRPACPLGTDPGTVTDTFTKLVLPLINKPVTLGDGMKLSYQDAITGTIDNLYRTRYWPHLRLALQELGRGHGEDLMVAADAYRGRQDDGSYNSFSDAYVSINCVDDIPVTDPARRLEMDERVRQVAPFRDDGHGPNPARDACAFWPVPNTSQAHPLTVTGLPQVMVVAVTGDPVTPYQSGVNLAKALNARLFTAQGTQHTVALQGTPCVDDILTNYLVTLSPPPDGAQCAIAP